MEASPLHDAALLRRNLRACAPILAAPILLTGCTGVQSALSPASPEAGDTAVLFWGMAIAAALIWLAVMALTQYAARTEPGRYGERAAGWIIIAGGVVFPVTALAGLLVFGLGLLPGDREQTPLTVRVSGEQWWWRIAYEHPAVDGPVTSANELRLPAGEPVAFVLDSPDVIHSFWIPSLGGKLDMIPGRTNRLVLTPQKAGRFRGVCAEYCGTAHALMAFDVIVMPPAQFARWLRAESASAAEPQLEAARKGLAIYRASGCAACHTIRGVDEAGRIGPDLTHVGSRASLAAGILPNTPQNLARWIAAPALIKPGVHMPGFAMLPQDEIDALAVYLSGLD